LFEYEIFDPRKAAIIVSVANYGLTFSQAAVEILGQPSHIILGFDKRNLVIVVKPVDESEARKIPFIEKKKNGCVRINSKEFVRSLTKYFPDDKRFTSKAIRYLSYWRMDIGALVIDLRQPMEALEEETDDTREGKPGEAWKIYSSAVAFNPRLPG
jgi:hypothetical protein